MPVTQFITVAAFTGGSKDPSARLRVRQYIRDLGAHGVNIDEYYPLIGSAHPPQDGSSRVPWLLSQLRQRLRQIRVAHECDVTLLQRQLIATINTFESLVARPRILDVDDAIWLTCRFSSVDRLARNCNAVICGNDFLAEHFSVCNRSIFIVPTTVDTRIWKPADSRQTDHRRVIGWIGTRGNHKYLYGIESALLKVLESTSDTHVMVVSDMPPRFSLLPASRIIYRPWSESTEIRDVQSMSVGVMPLEDSLWARGKCSCKLLQYLACGLPAVASPVGTNVQIASHGGALLANSQNEWVDALQSLLKNDALRAEMGATARATVVRNYSTQTAVAELARIFHQYA